MFGRFIVTPTRPALIKAGKLFNKVADFFELKAQVEKLAFWPESQEGEKVVDLDWSWVRGAGKGIGELRIRDHIGGRRNLRVIFYVADNVLQDDPARRIWILTVMDKKRDKFSSKDIELFVSRKKLLLSRDYAEGVLVSSNLRVRRAIVGRL